MRFVIFGCGAVGRELARRWAVAGHDVTGTTPDPAALPAISATGATALQVSPDDADRIRALAGEADAAVVASRPAPGYGRSVRERALAYRRQLMPVVRAAAANQPRLVLFSSIVVYGPGEDQETLTEQSPPGESLDPGVQSFATVERMVRESRQSVALRLPELLTGDRDAPTPAELVRTAYELTGPELPFAPDALCYQVDHRDAAAAAAFAVERELAGVYNVIPPGPRPATAEAYFGKLAGELGLAPLTFGGAPAAPQRPVSGDRLLAAGFRFQH